MNEKVLPGLGAILLFASLFGCAGMAPPGASPESRVEPKEKKLAFEAPAVTVCRKLDPLPEGTCQVASGGDGLLLIGNILAPDGVYVGGEVVISPQGEITYVGCGDSEVPGAAGATVVTCPTGVVSPGLINAHDHLTYDQNLPGNWGQERYDHRNQWRKGLDGHHQIPAPRATDDLQVAWAELRHVMGGTTSIAGSGGVKGFLRNLDKKDLLEGLDEGVTNYVTFPLGDYDGTMLDQGCGYPKIVDPTQALESHCFLPHVAEGIDQAALNEILCLSGQEQQGVDVVGANGAFIHTVGALAPNGQLLRERKTSVIWSPRSNVALYGNTATVTMYDTLGINLALSTDWTPSGSVNLLRELKCADNLNRNYLDSHFSDQDLWRMVTANAADALQVGDSIGRLEQGRVADISIYDGKNAGNPYRAVIDAGVKETVLVLRAGQPLYGDSEIMSALPGAQAGCEDLPGGTCGSAKTVCASRETGKSFADLARANQASYGLFFCGVPSGEPSCLPFRNNEYPGFTSEPDKDGDGVPDKADNCPSVFNPIRPLDNGNQADYDRDQIGDACDPAPLGLKIRADALSSQMSLTTAGSNH